MNTRRKLLIALGTAAYVPQALFGQTTKQPVLIGWLSPGTRAGNALNLAAFKEGMAALGWKEGATYILHERWADGQIARLPTLADEIAAYKPALIVAMIVPTARAVAKIAPNMPIVEVILPAAESISTQPVPLSADLATWYGCGICGSTRPRKQSKAGGSYQRNTNTNTTAKTDH